MARVITEDIRRNVESTLFDNGPLAREDLGLTPYQCRLLLADKVIRRAPSDKRTGNRGRPAHTFRLTDAARKRVKRARAAA